MEVKKKVRKLRCDVKSREVVKSSSREIEQEQIKARSKWQMLEKNLQQFDEQKPTQRRCWQMYYDDDGK